MRSSAQKLACLLFVPRPSLFRTYAVSANDADLLRGGAARREDVGRRRLHLQLLGLLLSRRPHHAWPHAREPFQCSAPAHGRGASTDLGHGGLEDKVGQHRGRSVLEHAVDVDDRRVGLVALRVEVQHDAVLVVADDAARLGGRGGSERRRATEQIAQRVERRGR